MLISFSLDNWYFYNVIRKIREQAHLTDKTYLENSVYQ